MFNRIIKGDFGYITKKRNRVILLTILYFAISVAIIVTGYVTTGTKKNLLTVVGILGCLPACKSAVSMIMFIRAKGCSAKTYDSINPLCDNLISMYDMYFTSYSKNYPISHMIVNNSVIIGIYEADKFDEKECISHLDGILKAAGYKNITISLTNDIEKYKNMLISMNEKANTSESKDDDIRISLYEVSL